MKSICKHKLKQRHKMGAGPFCARHFARHCKFNGLYYPTKLWTMRRHYREIVSEYVVRDFKNVCYINFVKYEQDLLCSYN
jgi:hypothetical protein